MPFAFFRDPGYGQRLEAPRIYLRPPAHRDFREWRRQRLDSRNFLEPWEPTWSEDAHDASGYRRRCRICRDEWRRDEAYSFFIFRRQDQALLGGITLRHIRRIAAQMGVVGYWMSQAHARQGYMSEGLGALLDFAFDDLGLHRIEAACVPENLPSAGLLIKLGFREEGRARAYLRIAGRWQDHRLFAILAEDRRQLRRG